MIIKVLTLDGCSICQNFKNRLIESSIKFQEMTCEKYPDTCDSIESMTGCESYPITMLVSNKNEIFEVIFLAKNYAQLQEGAKTSSGITCIPQHSIDNVLIHIKKRLNLNK